MYGQKTMLGDINNDGYDDIVSIGVNGTPTAGKVLVGMGNNMKFNMWSWISAAHVNPTDEFLLEDVNGDGRADLIVRNPYNNIYIAFAQYDSSISGGFTGFEFWSLTFSPSSLTNSSIVLAGDINGDNKADLAVINPSGSIVVHMKTDTSYSTSSPISVAAVKEAHLADVTGNGNMDIVIRGTNGYLTVIRFNNGFYSWTSPCVVFNPPDKMFLADVNGDGRTDLIARGALPANEGWIYSSLGNTDGSFGPANGPWGIWNNSSHGQEISSTDALYFADLNGDGRADYISIGLSFIEIRYGNSSGFFTYSSTTRGTINCTMLDKILFGKFTPYNRQDILCIKSGTKSVSVGMVWAGSYYNWVWYSGQGYLIS